MSTLEGTCAESEGGAHEIVDVELEDYVEGQEKIVILFICDLCGVEGRLVVPVADIEWPLPPDDDTREED